MSFSICSVIVSSPFLQVPFSPPLIHFPRVLSTNFLVIPISFCHSCQMRCLERERERDDSFNFSRSLASAICQRAQGDAKDLRKALHMKWLLSLSCLNSRKELKLSKNGKYSDISLATLIDFFSFFNHLLLPSFKSPKRALLRPLFHALAAKVWTQLDLIRPFIVYRGKQKGM